MNPVADSTPHEVAPADGAAAPASVVLLFFAAARVAAGTAREEAFASTVGDALDGARARHGTAFSRVLEGSRVWVNGEPVSLESVLRDGDEVAVLPPVSGGAGRPGARGSGRLAGHLPA
jgi:sulfur-carrier protein